MPDYAAIVCRVKTRPFPGADRLKLADAQGYQVVVGLDTEDGALGLLFPPDGALSPEYCTANGLYRDIDPETGKNRGGYFGDNGRITVQRFRGHRSEAYWAELDTLAFTGLDISGLREGDRITVANGVPVCAKWINPETLKARAAMGGRQPLPESDWFRRHVETDHLRHATDADFPPGSLVYYTEKLHGTSHREGRIPLEQKAGWLDRLARLFGLERRQVWQTVAGSRRVVLGEHRSDAYYGGDFRDRATAGWRDRLRRGEVVYGEIVGWQNEHTPIMATHDPAKAGPEFAKNYPAGPMVYSYGAARGECRFYVYRIVQHSPDGHPLELTHRQLIARANELRVGVVPNLAVAEIGYEGDAAAFLKDHAERYVAGPSTLDASHEREGVVARVERPDGRVTFWKHKGFAFRVMEGIAADIAVDIEEAA